jgi:hypothetical protein
MAVNCIVKYEASEDKESDGRNVLNDIGRPFLSHNAFPDNALGSVFHAPSLNAGAEEAQERQTDRGHAECK